MNIISHRYRLRSIDKPTNIYIYIYILISNSHTYLLPYFTSLVHLRPSQHKNKREFVKVSYWKTYPPFESNQFYPICKRTNFNNSNCVKYLIMKKLFFHSDINSTRFWV